MMNELGKEGNSSNDEEDDHRNLIHRNDTVSPFEIDDNFKHKLRKFNKRRYLLLVVLIPLLLGLIYFLFGFYNASRLNVSFSKYPFDQMRDNELRALNLLREQQLGLIALLNDTFSRLNSSSFGNLNLSGIDVGKSGFEELKGRVYDGLMLNKEIQKVLLESHNYGNVTQLGVGNGDLMLGGFDMCGKVGRLGERRTIEWNPRSGKYLFAICVSGQMSNHLICLEKHMFFAAVLGRVLVIPSQKVDYEFDKVLDIEHINECLGKKVAVTFDEFVEARKKEMSIDTFICYFTDCYMDDDHVKKLEALGLSLPKLKSPWGEDVKKPKKRTIEDVKGAFSSDDDVIAIGDVFFADVEKEWVMQPGGPIAHECRTLVEPSRLIMLTAQRFVQTFLGKNYVALHFRRHGWLKFCNAKSPSCYYSVPQAANCIKRVVERANTPVIYLSTDAADSETGLLQSLVIVDGKAIPLVQRPAQDSAEKWDALLYRHGLDGDSQVDAMLDKTICAMSSVFIGSSGSTFTEDILRLRRGWASASVCDEYICQVELPNFIAEDE